MFNLNLRHIVAVISLFFCSVTNASLITYTFDGVGSGILDGTAFNDEAFSFTLVANTDNLSGTEDTALIFDPLDSALVNISSFGDVLINIPTRFGITSSRDILFFSNIGAAGLDLIDIVTFTPIDFLADLAPITSRDAFVPNEFNDIATSQGLLTFTDTSNVEFSISVAQAVPEPSALALFGLALAGMAVRRRKANKAC